MQSSLHKYAIEKIKENKLIKKSEKIVLGVSGGPDSIFMLYILNALKHVYDLELFVCHINHGIREEAKFDQGLVEDFCKKNNLKFFSKEICLKDIIKKTKRTTEEEGRYQRYTFFEEVYTKFNCDSLMIAHNIDDNVETILLNIIRGAGLSGLCGLSVNSYNFNMNIKRPILSLHKKDIIDFLDNNNIEYAIDKTNFENDYTRNKIRNIIIPELSKINPNIQKAILNLSQIAKEDEEYINYVANEVLEDILIEDSKYKIILNSKKLRQQKMAIKKKIIILVIEKLFENTKNIAKIHIDDIILLIDNNIGNKYLMPNKNLKVYVNNGKVILTKLN